MKRTKTTKTSDTATKVVDLMQALKTSLEPLSKIGNTEAEKAADPPAKACTETELCRELDICIGNGNATTGLFIDIPINLRTGDYSKRQFLVYKKPGRNGKFLLCKFCPFCGGQWGLGKET